MNYSFSEEETQAAIDSAVIKKGKQDFTCEELSSGLLASPLRIRLS